jgi:hypothetical protein
MISHWFEGWFETVRIEIQWGDFVRQAKKVMTLMLRTGQEELSQSFVRTVAFDCQIGSLISEICGN